MRLVGDAARTRATLRAMHSVVWETNWLKRCQLWSVFRRYTVQIPVGVSTIQTEVRGWFPPVCRPKLRDIALNKATAFSALWISR